MKFYLSRIALLFMLLLLSRNISYSQPNFNAQKKNRSFFETIRS